MMANSVQTSLQAAQAEFQLLRQEYEQQLPQKIHLITSVGRSLLQEDWNLDKLRHLRLLSHRLMGSSATFEFADVSCAAHQVESCVDTLLRLDTPPTEKQRLQLQQALHQLNATLATTQLKAPAALFASKPADQTKQNSHVVFLVEDDPDLARYLSLSLSHFGYTVCHFEHVEGLQEAMQQVTPAAIIMDIVLPEGELAGTEAIATIQEGRDHPLPVLFISARDDLTARLQAVRAGGSAYFTKPVDAGELLTQLDILTNHDSREPYRVLIIEDDVPLANYYALILQQAGIMTSVVTDPLQVMSTLIDSNPDLILMDLYLPECNGIELAAILRQHGAYVGIPIVFLSAENGIERQLAAVRSGGDMFLTKPIQPDHLVAAILPRLQRSSILRSLIERDSLTGLLNHTKIKEQLCIEIQRASRQASALVLAMIDIDHFKRVNDTYGHLAGDRVLKNLSRLLQQRLRRADIIGRYGGEEFAIIFPDTDPSAAFHVVDEIRQGFAQMVQKTDNCEFLVTFSCGIAGFPQYLDATSLSKAADRALYEAKHQGRDRIVISEE
ncbi:diguanylate cyclase [Oscillatoria sp. FACHB-1407]|uniref:response regulator n=1 Tax=Oscillatoria sp. FACHB-1407 TaxID=2692847 RepID=UPI0016883F1C|nr:response regulator [Oscillatoria sp. FACHB-1407]MBD2461650.1 diguanylate cyclase [Oscillatoria sp. FACHB-1407]